MRRLFIATVVFFAVLLYHAAGPNVGIATAQETKPTSTPVPRRWVQVMSEIPKDPWGQPYGYRFPGKKKANEHEIFSKGKDGQDGNADDLSSQDSE